MNIYVASSWRNQDQQSVVDSLRKAGHKVYDFKHPTSMDRGFSWAEIDRDWRHWSSSAFTWALTQPPAERGFKFDMDALSDCDACVLVNPCGRSAHLAAGYAIGAKKPTAILLNDGDKPELMYKMAAYLAGSIADLLAWADEVGRDFKEAVDEAPDDDAPFSTCATCGMTYHGEGDDCGACDDLRG